jgi:hypothetical protein
MSDNKGKEDEASNEAPIIRATRKSWFRKAMVAIVAVPVVVIGAVLAAKRPKD